MESIKKFSSKSFFVTLFVVACALTLSVGLKVLKDSHAETSIGGDSPAASRYNNNSRGRLISGYQVKFKDSSGKLKKSNRMGYMNFYPDGDKSRSFNVFCAFRGKNLSNSVNYTRQSFEQYYASNGAEWRQKLYNIIALYSPGKTSLDSIKQYFATNYPNEYAQGIGNISEKEIAVAFQAGVWTFTNGDSDYEAITSDPNRNHRINLVYNILAQRNGYLKNVPGGTITPIDFTLNSDLALNNSINKYQASIKTSASAFNANSDKLTLTLRTSGGTTIPNTNYSITTAQSGGAVIYNITFNDGVFIVDNNGKIALASTSEEFNAIYITTNVLHGVTGKKVFVYVPDRINYQSFLGMEEAPVTSVSYISLTAPEVKKVSIEIDKLDEENTSATALIGALLRLYRVEGGNLTQIAEWYTNQSTKVISDLQPGTYRIVEVISPSGYENSNIKVTYSNDHIDVSSGKDFVLSANHEKFYVHVMNKKTELKIKKVDSSGKNYVSGAVFAILESDGAEAYRFTTVDDALSIKGELDVGTYFMVELEAPTNYIKSNKVYRFKVGGGLSDDSDVLTGGPYKDYPVEEATYDNNTHIVTIKNNEGLSISKKSIVDDAVYVIGATLTITNSKGEIIDTWVTDEKDHIVTKEMADGKYTLTETIPAPGYATASSIEFEIINGKVQNNVDINMKDAPLQVCIAKKSTNKAGNLAGAEFEMYDSNNKLITKFTTTDEEYCAPLGLGLKPGEYTLKETKAPKGYKGASVTKIIIKDTDELQKFEVLNEVEVPKTALNTSSIVYIATIIMGISGIGLVCYYVKKYNY